MRNQLIAIRDQTDIKIAVGLAILLELTKIEEELPLIVAAVFANTGIEAGINPTTAHLVALMEPEVVEPPVVTDKVLDSTPPETVVTETLTPSNTINEPEFLKKSRAKKA
jgi:hypothetical protein